MSACKIFLQISPPFIVLYRINVKKNMSQYSVTLRPYSIAVVVLLQNQNQNNSDNSRRLMIRFITRLWIQIRNSTVDFFFSNWQTLVTLTSKWKLLFQFHLNCSDFSSVFFFLFSSFRIDEKLNRLIKYIRQSSWKKFALLSDIYVYILSSTTQHQRYFNSFQNSI